MKWMGFLLASLLSMPALADDWKAPDQDAMNPPATEALRNFQHFEQRPATLLPPFDEKGTAQSAVAHLEANMGLRSTQRVKEWNQASPADSGRTLVIETIIEHIRFVTPARRVFLGVLMGGSHVDMKLRLTDKDTGQVIGEPRFYQHASAGAAGWALGAVDRALVIRLSNMIDGYLRDNYQTPQATHVAVMQDLTAEQQQDAEARQQRAQQSP